MRRTVGWIALVWATACRNEVVNVDPPAPRLGLALAVSEAEADPGGRVAVRLTVDGSAAVAGISGWLGFDPTRLRFLGQPGPEGPFTIVNGAEARRGRLRMASLAMPQLDGAAGTLVFEVLAEGYSSGLWYQLELASDRTGRVIGRSERLAGAEAVSVEADLSAPRPLAIGDWVAALPRVQRPPAFTPGAGAIFGDATLDGLITIVDAFGAANLSVGNQPLLTDPSKDYVVAANVFPFNPPGLGEATDPVPPGLEANGNRVITIVDAVAIANEAVGNDQPVVGEAIPGRAAVPTRTVLTGTFAGDRTLARDTIYELQGVVKVPGGTTLTVEAGTRIEGDAVSRGTLMILRGGRIDAVGTPLEPVVMTCASPVPAPGCWGGLVINGLALLNNDVAGPGEIVACPEKQTIGSTELYGGCLNETNSGTLRYVRIEHAGQAVAGVPAPGLALLGVGLNTTVDFVQVHGSAGPGVFASGGVGNLRHLVITGSGTAGLAWDDGWRGLGQFILIQQAAGSGPGLQGSNYGLNPNAGPRSRPDLFHVTLLGSPMGSGSTGVHLFAGSGLALRSSIIAGFSGAGFDIDDPATCALLVSGTDIAIEGTYFHQNAEDFATDIDCADEPGYGSQPARANVQADPQLIAPFATVSIDPRPVFGSPAGAGAILATGAPFFDALAGYFGSTEAASAAGNVIPWFAGWIRGWSGPVP
ncbi:MAG: cohesin domain-containing protein [Gemmatimonadales bacterium]